MTNPIPGKLDEQEWKVQVKYAFQKLGEKPHKDPGLSTAVMLNRGSIIRGIQDILSKVQDKLLRLPL